MIMFKPGGKVRDRIFFCIERRTWATARQNAQVSEIALQSSVKIKISNRKKSEGNEEFGGKNENFKRKNDEEQILKEGWKSIAGKAVCVCDTNGCQITTRILHS